MTLDEAIKHCLEVADKHKRHAKILDKRLLGSGLNTADDCRQCAADHMQLAEWLQELKVLRNSIGAVKLEDMKEAVGLLEEFSTENDRLTSQLTEAKRLLKLAIDDANTEAESLCAFCKHNDLVDGCPYIESYSECEYIWRYTDEALKLIGNEYKDEI